MSHALLMHPASTKNNAPSQTQLKTGMEMERNPEEEDQKKIWRQKLIRPCGQHPASSLLAALNQLARAQPEAFPAPHNRV